MEALKILLACVASAVVYGIAHDQVTARVCLEYFTVAHPPLIDSTSPTLVAFAWGTVATWWVGLGLGLPITLLARLGPWPKLTWRPLLRPLAVLLLTTAVASLLAGVAGHAAAATGRVAFPGGLAQAIPEAEHVDFMAVWWAHQAAYGVGQTGGLAICGWVAWRRWWEEKAQQGERRAAKVTASA